MRRAAVLLVVSCGSNPASAPADAGRDAIVDVQPDVPQNTNPGPDDQPDSGLPAGTACTPGEVQSFPVASRVYWGLVVDDTSFYWLGDSTSDAGYWGVPTNGGTPVVITDEFFPQSIALDGSWIYFGSDAGVYRSHTDGTGFMAVGPPSAGGLAVDATRVWWSTGTEVLAWCKLP